MTGLVASLARAAALLLSRDPDALAAIGLSFRAALTSTALGTLVGAPLGLAVGVGRFRGRDAVQTVLQSLLALPTVVVGLAIYLLISRRGPLGSLGLLFTPAAIILGQIVLAVPVVAAHTAAAARALDPRARETALALGAGPFRLLATVAGELRVPLCTAVAAAFGRVISEIGVAMILGGNIRGETRTMTTTIALETAKGDFELALALGLVLVSVVLVLNTIALRLQK